MNKIRFLAAMLTLLTLFSFGCNSADNSQSDAAPEVEVIPSFEELIEINSYEHILKNNENCYVKNEWVAVSTDVTNLHEFVLMQNEEKIEYILEESVVGEEGYIAKLSRLGNEWYYYSANDPQMPTPFFSALEIDCQFFDYVLPELIYGEPIGRAYIEDDYIVYHASYIRQATEDYEAKRSDFTYYFNKETKLIEKIYELEYDNTNSVVAIYNVEFVYNIKIEDYFSQTIKDYVYNYEKRIDIEVVVKSGEEQKTYSFVATTDSQHIVVIGDKFYNLYTDAECTDLVESLARFEGQKSVTLYAKEM
jgi:hypothetical protein